MVDSPFANERALHYAEARGIEFISELGSGVNGQVWYTNRHTAVKVFGRQVEYDREWNAYARLAEWEVKSINEFAIPELLAWDEKLLVIEISAVTPPFVLDFAGAYLDYMPEFPPEAIAEQRIRNAELFGAKWPRVQLLLAKLRSMGIYYVDINRGNIRFPEFDDEGLDDL